MQFTCTTDELSRALTIVGHAVPRNSPLPILSYVHVMTLDDQVQVVACNGEGLTLACRIQATIAQTGTVALPAECAAYIANLHAADVTLRVDEQYVCHLNCGRSQTTLRGVDPTEFPALPQSLSGPPALVLDAVLLKEIIQQIAFSASKDASRPIFTGIDVALNDEVVTCVAADTFRIALRRLPVLEEQHAEWLIPARAMTLLTRMLPDEGIVEMRVTPHGNQVIFHTRQLDLCTVLLEGTYPNYSAVLPQSTTTRAVVNRQAFAAAVKEVATFAKEARDVVHVRIRGSETPDADAQTLTLEASAQDMGSTISVLPATVSGADQLELYLSVKYLAEALAAMDMPEVAFEVLDPRRPVVLKPASGPIDAQYVIMPMTVATHTPPSSTSSDTPTAQEPVAAGR